MSITPTFTTAKPPCPEATARAPKRHLEDRAGRPNPEHDAGALPLSGFNRQ
ncbi:MAG: hypothetical protein M0Z66_04125 [Thermaerobacter sp.]|nr:hypothetical protein [Thermaerobacter sp.]